jgi:23S rRNA pseudouridine2605 synthase
MVDHSRNPNARRRARQGPPESAQTDAARRNAPLHGGEAPDEEAGEGGSEIGGERVAKALARAGVASRREVERLIAEGRVSLNGVRLDTPAVKIAPGDTLSVDGVVVGAAEPTRVWRYHKPCGLVTTHRDPGGRPTVFDALPPHLPRVISIGRLDLNSEGLLLLTNDGALARALELPASGWVRQYRARAYGRTTQAQLDTLKDGVTVDGVAYGPILARLDKVQRKAGGSAESSANVWISVSLTEGKNREVRRVLESLGLKVNRLVRLAYGPFALATLGTGQVEEVGPRVIREQLAAFIAPENLPTGSASGTGAVRVRAISARAAAASTIAAGAATIATAPAPAPKKVYKAGWARPKPNASPHAKPVAKRNPKGRHANEAAGPATLLSPRAAKAVAAAPRRATPAAPKRPLGDGKPPSSQKPGGGKPGGGRPGRPGGGASGGR